MSDFNPISLGLSTQVNLQLENNRLMQSITDVNKNITPYEYKPLVFTNFMTKINQEVTPEESISIEDALFSTDPQIQNLGRQALNKVSMQNTGVKQYLEGGIGTEIVPVTKESLKYSDEQYGYNPDIDNESSYNRREDLGHGAFYKAGRGLGRFTGRVLGTAVTKLGTGVGYVTGMVNPSNWDENYWNNVADNAFSTMFENAEAKIKEDYIPVFKPEGYDSYSLFNKLGTAAFWEDSVADGVAFMASAIVPGMAFSKLGAAAKFGKAFATLGNVAETAEAAGQIGKLANVNRWVANTLAKYGDQALTTVYNTASESFFEAKGARDAVVKDLTEQRDRGEINLTDEQIKQKAAEAAKNNFWANSAFLTLSNSMETAWMFKAFNKGKITNKIAAIGELENASFDLSKSIKRNAANNAYEKVSPATKLGKFASGKPAFYLKQFGKGILTEGFYEENIQLASERENTENPTGGYWNNMKGIISDRFFQQIENALSGKDSEAAESIFLGSLLGSVMGGGSSLIGKEYSKNEEKIKKYLDVINEAEVNWRKIGDVYKTEEKNGKQTYVKDEKGNLVIDNEKLKAREEVIDNVMSAFENRDSKNTTENFAAKYAFSTLVQSHINSGTFEHLISTLESGKSISEEEMIKNGFDPSSKNPEEITKLVSFAKEVKKISDVNNNIPLASKQEIRVAEQRKRELTNKEIFHLINIDEVAKLRNEYENDVNKLSINPADLDGNESAISKNNILHAKLKTIENTIAFFENQEETEYSKEKKSQYEELKKKTEAEIKESDTVLEEYLKNNKKDEYGFLNYKNDLRNTEELRSSEINLGTLEANMMSVSQEILKLKPLVGGYEYFEKIQNARKEKIQKALEKIKNKLEENKLKDDAKENTKEKVKNLFGDVEEKEEGDFIKLTEEALNEAFTGLLSTSEIVSKYEDLYVSLVQTFKDKVLDLRKKSLEVLQKSLENKIAYHTEKLESGKTRIKELQDVIKEAEEDLNKDVADLKAQAKTKTALKDIIKSTTETIKQLEKDLKTDQDALIVLEKEQEDLKTNILADVDIFNRELKMSELDIKEIDDLKNTIAENKKELFNLKKILKNLIQAVKKRFALIDAALGRVLKEGEEATNEELSNLEPDQAEEYLENKRLIAIDNEKIISTEEKIKQLQESLDLLNSQLKDVEKRTIDVSPQLKAIKDQIKSYAKTQAMLALRDRYNPTTVDKQLQAYFGPEFRGSAVPFTQGEEDKRNFDTEKDPYLKLLEEYFYTTKDPNYSDGNEQTNRHQRFINRLSQMSLIERATLYGKDSSLVALTITKHNIEAFGLNGLVDPKYFTKDVVDTGIYIVYALKQTRKGKTTYTLVDENNKPIKGGTLKTGKSDERQLNDSVLQQVVFSQIRKRNITNDKDLLEKYLELYSLEDIKEYEREAIAFYEELLENSKNIYQENSNKKFHEPFFLADKFSTPFIISKGIPNRHEVAEGVSKNAFTDTILNEKEINNSTVFIATIPDANNQQEVTTMGVGAEVIQKLTIGRPYIKTVGLIDQYHYADNNILSQNQIETIVEVIYKMSLEAQTKLNKGLLVFNKNKPLPNKNTQEYEDLLSAYFEDASVKKDKSINVEYIKYLKSVLYWSAPKDETDLNDVNNRQIWFRFGKLYLGNTTYINFNDPNSIKNSVELRTWLQKYNHNINKLSDKDSKEKHVEYYLNANKELKKRVWPSYNHYLLSSKNPDDTKRDMVPLTTQIKTKEQAKQNNVFGNEYFPYISKGVIIQPQKIEKKEKTNNTTNKTTKNNSSKKSSSSKESATEKYETGDIVQDENGVYHIYVFGEFKPYKGSIKGKEHKIKQNGPFVKSVPNNAKVGTPSSVNDIAAIVSGAVPITATTPVETPAMATKTNTNKAPTITSTGTNNETGSKSTPVNTPTTDINALLAGINNVFDDGSEDTETPPPPGSINARKTTTGRIIEEDLDFVIAEVSKMLPQVPIKILTELIKINDSETAWGQFTGKGILLYKGAEQGTLYHEAFEAIVNSILTDKEVNYLLKEFKNRKGSFIDRESNTRINYSEATDYQAKEELAEEFRDYKLTGRIYTQPGHVSIFKKILDFLKSLISNRVSIQQVFENLDNGVYGTRTLSSTTRFGDENYRRNNPQISEGYYQSFLKAATSKMFKELFLTNDSLTAIDEISFDVDAVYRSIKRSINYDYKNILEQIKNFTGTDSEKQIIALQFKEIADMWNSIANTPKNWLDFIEDHRMFVRQFGVAYRKQEEKDITDEETVLEDDEKESSVGRESHLVNAMEIDAKSSAPTSLKLLFAATPKSFFNGVVNGQVNINNSIEGDYSVMLESIDNTDELIQEVFEGLHGINDIEKIKTKFLDIIGLTDFNKLESKEEKENLLNSLNDKQASLYRIYTRLFNIFDNISLDAQYKLQVKFNNFVAKQKPLAKTMFVSVAGNIHMEDSSVNDFLMVMKNAFKSQLYEKNVTKSVKTITKVVETDENDSTKTKETLQENYVHVIKGFSIKEKDGKYKAITVNSTEKAKEIINALGLSEWFTSEFFNKLKYKTESEKKEFNDLLTLISQQIVRQNNERTTYSLSVAGVGLDDKFNKLTNTYMNVMKSSDSLTRMGVTQKQKQTYVNNNYFSRVLAEINNVKTIEEFYERNPHYQDTFVNNSYYIKKLFDLKSGNKTDFKLYLGIIEGWKKEFEKEGQSTSSLSLTSRFVLNLNQNINGMYNTIINADSESEWFLQMGNMFKYQNDMWDKEDSETSKEFYSIFKGYLEDELNLILNESGKNLQHLNYNTENVKIVTDENGNKKEVFRKTYESLRMFDGILSESTRKKVYAKIDSGFNAKKIIKDHKDVIEKDIKNFIEKQAKETLNTLQRENIVEDNGATYTMYSLDQEFAEKNLGVTKDIDESFTIGHDSMDNFLQWHAMNFVASNIEIYKLFFGDPAQFKDAEKRIKSMLSPVEWSFYDSTGKYNEHWNNSENVARIEDQIVLIEKDDLFYHDWSNELVSLAVKDIETADPKTYHLYLRYLGATAKAYGKTNEADAQSLVDILSYKEIMKKSGDRWTNAMEKQLQWDLAYARMKLSKKGKYKGYENNPALQELDKRILEKNPVNPSYTSFNVIKPLYSGTEVSEEFRIHLLKTSMFPMTYSVVEDTDMEDLFVNMLEGIDGKKVNIFTFESSTKAGLKLKEDGTKATVHDYNGAYQVQKFNKKDHPVSILSFKHFGIQVETQGDKAETALGTQTTKQAKGNLMSEGIPLDYLESIRIGDTNTFELNGKVVGKGDVFIHFDSLSLQERFNVSQDYKDLYNHEKSLSELKENLYYKMLSKFGAKEIEFQNEKGDKEFSYEIKDKTKLKELILDELTRRHIDQNTIDSIDLTEDLSSFVSSMETLPSYNIVRNIIYAIVDKHVVSPKVNGKSRIQVASTFFNKANTRKAIYLEDDEWVILNSKEEYDEAEAKGKNIIFADNELDAYSYKEGDKTISAMEIMLPNIYIKKVNAKRIAKGLKPLSEEELLVWLNKPENRILLEGIGFRIPTQAASSIEFFVIKKFLPPEAGSSIVVPSLITTKAGSDFDVDKLNTYMYNWVLDENGMPVVESFLDDSNSTVEERYVKYVKANTKKYNQILEKLKSNSKKENLEDEELTEEELEEKEKHDINIELGNTLFELLPLSLKQQYWDVSDKLDALDSDFINYQFTLKNLTEEYLKTFEEGGEFGINYINEDEKEDVEYFNSDKIVPLLRELRKNYITSLQNTGLTEKDIERISKTHFKSKEARKTLNFNLQFDLSKSIAESNSLFSFESFKEKPLHLQNTSTVLQNKYFTSIKTLISKPSNLKNLLMPNDNDQIKNKRDIISEAKEKGSVNKKKKSQIHYENMLSFSRMTEQRNNFVTGKKDVGVYAVASTNQIHNQIVGSIVKVDVDTLEDDDYDVIQVLNEGNTGLPFLVNTIRIYETDYISLGNHVDLSGLSIGEKISQYVSGAVDVAKDPILIEMGANSEFAGIYAFLERITDGETTALFMMQPYIRQYLKEIQIRNSILPIGKSKSEIISELSDRENKDFVYDPNFKVSKEKMIAAIKKSYTGEELTEDEKIEQVHIFRNFLKIQSYSNSLLANVMASNHDTSSFNNDADIYIKNERLEKVQKSSLIKTIKNGQFVSLAEAVLNFTFIGNDKNNLNKITNLFDEKTFVLKSEKINSIMKEHIKRIFKENPFLSVNAFNKMIRGIELSIMEYTISTSKDSNGHTLNDWIPILFDSDTPFEEDGVTPRNLYQIYKSLVKKIKSDPSHPLKDNYILNNFDIIKKNKDGIIGFKLKKGIKNNDIYTKDRATEALKLLRDHLDSNDFFEKLMIASYLRNGIKFTVDGINHLFPNHNYAALLNERLKNVNDISYEIVEESYIRKNKIADLKVSKLKAYSYINFIKTPNGDLGIASLKNTMRYGNQKEGTKNLIKTSKTKGYGKKKKSSAPSVLLHSVPSVENKASHIIFVSERDASYYSSLKDYLVVPNVKPGYNVNEMMAARDWSFMEYVLYRRIGLGTSKSLRSVSKAEDGKDYIKYGFKPLATVSSRELNEINKLKQGPSGEFLADTSILSTNPQYQEIEDADIFDAFDDLAEEQLGLEIFDEDNELLEDIENDTRNPKFNKLLKLNNSFLNNTINDVPLQDETNTKVEITKSNYTRREVQSNPNTAYVFTENTYSITAFPNKQGGGSAIIRPEPNAFAIVTKKKYDYNTKENVDYTDTDTNFKEFTDINTKLIQELKNSGKSKIVFPQGFATDKAKMPTRFAEWLQKELLDNFGLVTELNSTKTGLISKSVEDISNEDLEGADNPNPCKTQ